MKYKVTLVNYINTLPFIEGLSAGTHIFDLDKRIPKECGDEFKKGEADIALVPVGYLPRIESDYVFISDFGIASNGPVRTVKLLSQCPRDQITDVYLDPHSTTSVALLKLLFDDFWKQKVQFHPLNLTGNPIASTSMLIGDKVFKNEGFYKYQYDLGEIWKSYTGLPFVYAIWICKPTVPKDIVSTFKQLLSEGLSDKDGIITKHSDNYNYVDLDAYFNENIKYRLTEEYLNGFNLFMERSKAFKKQIDFV